MNKWVVILGILMDRFKIVSNKTKVEIVILYIKILIE
jgi:hypothetical protein